VRWRGVVHHAGEVFGKPKNVDDARRILRRLSDSHHEVTTGHCLIPSDDRPPRSASCTTMVRMRAWTEAEIESYIASGECWGRAGAYAIQETGDRFVTELDGPFDNVVGLHVATVRRLMAEAG